MGGERSGLSELSGGDCSHGSGWENQRGWEEARAGFWGL